MKPPTARQLDVLRFIASFLEANGYPPTNREVAEHFGWYHTGARPGVRGGGGSNTVVCHVEALEAKGLVRRLQSAQKARAIRITREGYRALGCLACPTCGTFKVGAAAA